MEKKHREFSIPAYFTEPEMNKIKTNAERMGLTLSAYLRLKGLDTI